MRIALTVAANRGLTTRYGEQPVPLRWSHPGAAELAQVLAAAGVPTDWAVAQLESMAAACTLERPPRSVRYWAESLLELWHVQESRATPMGPGVAVTEDGIPVAAALRYARSGDAEWRQYCEAHGLDWHRADDAEAEA